VSIELRCESCGKRLQAPRESAGKRSKCPACQHEVYIPTPEDEIEELPFAPEDAADLAREASLQAERRRLDRALAHEDGSPPEEAASLQEIVVAFLVAMRDSDLSRADDLLAALRRRQSEAVQAVDRLAADQIPPAEMAGVPPGVYQGFLKSLRSQL